MSRRYQDRSNKRPFKKYQKRYEEKGIILDIITSNTARRRDIPKGETRAHVLGSTWFTILEVCIKDGQNVLVMEKTSLNKEEETKIDKIVNRIAYDKLTTIGVKSLDRAIESILTDEEKRFITWINQSNAISIRLHKLQLIKGIGPKFMKLILEERKVVPFINYEDFEERTKVKDIKALIKQRILDEIRDSSVKYNLFTRSMPKTPSRRERRRY